MAFTNQGFWESDSRLRSKLEERHERSTIRAGKFPDMALKTSLQVPVGILAAMEASGNGQVIEVAVAIHNRGGHDAAGIGARRERD